MIDLLRKSSWARTEFLYNLKVKGKVGCLTYQADGKKLFKVQTQAAVHSVGLHLVNPTTVD